MNFIGRDSMYDNTGGKIKVLTTESYVLGIIGSLIGSIDKGLNAVFVTNTAFFSQPKPAT